MSPRLGRRGQAGGAGANDQDVEGVAQDLPRLSLVALHFPKWVDGRAYSQARLLRARWRFAGQLRATGDVLVDMLPLLHRTGFDAVVLRADQREDAARRAFTRVRFRPGEAAGHGVVKSRIRVEVTFENTLRPAPAR